MKKIVLYSTVIVVFLLLGVHIESNAQKPNIVLIIADDVSKSDIGCYGNNFIKTPKIDALAKNGMKFDNAFLTISSCSPSRASIITGRYPHNTGAAELHSPLGDEQVLFPKLLKDAGYYTAQAGKWHIGGDSSEPNGVPLIAFDRTGGSKKNGGGESGAKMWVTYLKERPKDKPFFMWFAAHDAHSAYWDKEIDYQYNPDDIKPSKFYVNNAETRKELAGYYNELTRFDSYVGKVVEELKVQNVLDNTIIVIIADNGRGFPRAKFLLNEDGIATPMVIYFPKKIKQEGATCKSLISVIDLAPTFVELAGAKVSPTFQGKSFTKLFSNPTGKFREYVFAEHNWNTHEAYQRMIATSDYMLVVNKRPNIPEKAAMSGSTGKALIEGKKNNTLTTLQREIFAMPRPEITLFNRLKDPEQLNNLAGKEKTIVKQLLDILYQWQYETGDTVPEYLKPDRSDKKSTDYMSKVEMPGASKNAKMINKPGPF